MTRTKSSRALVSVVLAVLMAVAFMPAISYTSFAATAKKATKVTKVYHTGNKTYTRTVGSAWTLKYKLSPSKLTTAAKKVVWKSSNKSVVSVSAKSGNKAAVSFKKVGTATVTVYTKANKKAKATWKFKVVPKSEAKKVAATGVTVKANNSTDYTKSLEVGTELTATVAPADATGVTYQWYADGTAIAGATDSQFTVTSDQIGKKITVKAKANTGDEVTSAESAAVSKVNVSTADLQKKNDKSQYVSVTATEPVGTELKVALKDGTKDLGTSAAKVQWYRIVTGTNQNGTSYTNEVAISGATSNTYTLTKDDIGYQVEAKVTLNNGVTATGLNKTIDKTGAFTLGPVKATGEITVKIQADGKTVSGVKTGTALTAVVEPSDASVTYQWQKAENGSYTNVATGATYTPSKAGTYRVVATLATGEKVYSASNPVATVVVADNVIDGATIANENVGAKNVPGSWLRVQSATVSGTNLVVNNGSAGVKLTDADVEWFGVKAGTTTEVSLGKNLSNKIPAGYEGGKIFAKVKYNGVTVKSNEITVESAKTTLTGSASVISKDGKTLSIDTTGLSIKDARGYKITWYSNDNTQKNGKYIGTTVGTSDTVTPGVANAGKWYFAVIEGTGNNEGKVFTSNCYYVKADGTVVNDNWEPTDVNTILQ